MDDFITDLLNLPNVNVLNIVNKPDAVYIQVESTETNIPCRVCGKPTKSKGLGQEVKLRHLPMLGKPCYLLIKPKRGICENCDDHPTTNQRVGWYEYKSRYTTAYEDHVLLP